VKTSVRGFPVEVTIQNVVASARFNHAFDLNAMAKALPSVEYRPKVFPGIPFKQFVNYEKEVNKTFQADLLHGEL